MIENTTNRQVTFSKRRGGLLKKAEELSVLCDSQILLVMSTSNHKAFKYCTPSTNIKQMIDRYQSSAGIDLWNGPYEEMQKQLAEQIKINAELRKEIRQRMGEELDDIGIQELRLLEEDLEAKGKIVREKKFGKIGTQTTTSDKKVRSFRSQHNKLVAQMIHMEAMKGIPNYGFLGHEMDEYKTAEAISLANVGEYDAETDDPNHYKSASGLGSGAFRLQPNQPNLHDMGYGLHDLRLA